MFTYITSLVHICSGPLLSVVNIPQEDQFCLNCFIALVCKLVMLSNNIPPLFCAEISGRLFADLAGGFFVFIHISLF